MGEDKGHKERKDKDIFISFKIETNINISRL